ncbi:ATP-dependent DNA helicase [Vitreoscilla sp. C1]|uniref:UvrD-helicase domain-containing protein n=1 Tax=Vitreoscilla sp. (strain C1) TaxID=96942 RepID=UPI00148E90B2|nr:UvrD-helicase domain-containing protein [Vitreoscilla sp. C1]AUZ04930.2 ATP-dependent DNA helicase [Vitreoscilla sp. C1]
MQLNQQQQQAVLYLDGPLLVLAGAGSGKTSVITKKIAHLVNHAHYPAHQIAAITFTNKAAKEMQERVAGLLSKQQCQQLTVSTFHSLGMRILREEAPLVGLKKKFSIFDSGDSAKILQELLQTSGKDALFRAQQCISLWKNAFKTPEQALDDAANEWEKQIALVYASYQETLLAYQAVDFDDLIRIPTLLLQNNAEVRYKWQSRLRYLLVDECQDTNECQYALLKLLIGSDGKFTAVGDDDQSIYAWRGANLENLRLLQQDYPNMKVIKLEQNYRSTSRILRIANKVISHNPKLFEKKLWSEYGLGEMVQVLACKDEEHEADTVASKIAFLKNSHPNVKLSDFAILYRGNHQAKRFEEALRSSRLPYKMSGGQSFFDRAEIKDVMAYLRLLNNPDDDPAFIRAITTPKRGIGESTLTRLNEFARDHNLSLYQAAQQLGALSTLNSRAKQDVQAFMLGFAKWQDLAEHQDAGDFLWQLLDEIHYEAHLLMLEEGKAGEIKWRNVVELQRWIANKGEKDGKNILEVAQTIALMTLLEGKDQEEVDAVNMMTLHASKGLEFPCVFLVGCEEGVFPHRDSVDEGMLDEERRLMYVGITRAKRQLFVTHCVKRKKAGEWQFMPPSRFIDEMPSDDIQILGRKNTAPIVSKAEGKSRLSGMMNMLKDK